ncbi:adenylate kinase 8 isoform X4 [Rhodnius prolixus]|uniref:adenylate kinase 8 isoform X4 n=1 Tax=Rhodnius prolixus TaxID=13249 RepID=UPI003D188818
MEVNETMQKLKVPQNYAPYLQKMGIYDFFYDIAVTYALHQPEDHVIFLRNYLCSLQDTTTQIKILIIGSPHIDKRTLSLEIAEKLNLLVISFKDIKEENTKLEYCPKTLALNLEKIIQQKLGEKKGWILFDYPRDRLQARSMKKRAINPTHTFQLVPSPQYYSKRDLWNENLIDKDPQELREMIECYKRTLVELRASFGDTIKEVVIRGRTLSQIAKSCVINAKQMLPKGGASIPRVVIIGEMAKKIENVAKNICEHFDLIFINMEEVVCQGKNLDNELGKHLRQLEKRHVPIYGKLVLALVQNRLMGIDCLNEGWVMVNFPRDRIDFEALDTFDTPPNRVIFLIPTDINKRELFRKWVALKPRDYAQELRNEACKKEQSTSSGSSENIYNSLSEEQLRDKDDAVYMTNASKNVWWLEVNCNCSKTEFLRR